MQLVAARCSRAWYGTDIRTLYEPEKYPWHKEREHTKYLQSDGDEEVDSTFDLWCAKGEHAPAEVCKTFRYVEMYDKVPHISLLSSYSVKVFACENEDPPTWMYAEKERGRERKLLPGLRHVCTIHGDLRPLHPSLKEEIGPKGEKFCSMRYAVELFFGGTTLSARLAWTVDVSAILTQPRR